MEEKEGAYRCIWNLQGIDVNRESDSPFCFLLDIETGTWIIAKV